MKELDLLFDNAMKIQVNHVSDHTKVALAMDALVMACRIRGVNVFQYLQAKFGGADNASEIQPNKQEYKCQSCGKVFSSLAALTGHGPARCRSRSR